MCKRRVNIKVHKYYLRGDLLLSNPPPSISWEGWMIERGCVFRVTSRTHSLRKGSVRLPAHGVGTTKA